MSEPPQHIKALELANRIRLARAQIGREIKAGTLTVEEVLREQPFGTHTWRVGDLLRAQKRWGRTRARKFLQPLEVHEQRTLERLTDRQRAALIEALEERRKAQRPASMTSSGARSEAPLLPSRSVQEGEQPG